MRSNLVMRALSLACLALASMPLLAQAAQELPLYKPSRQFSGTVHSWGHGFLKDAMKNWEMGFRKYQPDVRFDDTLVSSAAAIAGLYAGRADIGVLAREITPPETAAYEKMTRQKLFPIDVLTGSMGNPDKVMTLGIFVNKANPLAQLDYDQLDAIFSAERRRGEAGLIRTWGQLGLSGDWTERTIAPYSGPAFEAPGYFFSQTVLRGSVLWNCDLKQLEDLKVAGKPDIDGYQRIVDAVGADRYAIGLTGAGYRNPNAKLIAIVSRGNLPVLPTAETVADRSYSLARPVRFYINNGPNMPPDPIVMEFFRYVFSRQGREDAAREGSFFPVPVSVAVREREHLEAVPKQGPLAH